MITILTGPVGGGKTTLLKAAIPAFRARGIRVGGYLSERVMEGSTVLGYDLLDIRTGRRHPFLRVAGRPGEETVGPFALDPAGLAAAIDMIGSENPSDVFILDELGRLELEGRGVWPAARHLLETEKRDIVIVIRAALLEAYQALFRAEGRPVSVVSLAQCPGPEAFADEVLKIRT